MAKSPICYLCNKDFGSEYFHLQTGGDHVRFADFRRLPEGAAGQPHGIEWFCAEHLQAAAALAAEPVEHALSKLHEAYGWFPPYESKPSRDPELWVTAVGPNSARVFTLLRQKTLLPPTQARELLTNAPFKFTHGWPRYFENWRVALVEAGAAVEIRFP